MKSTSTDFVSIPGDRLYLDYNHLNSHIIVGLNSSTNDTPEYALNYINEVKKKLILTLNPNTTKLRSLHAVFCMKNCAMAQTWREDIIHKDKAKKILHHERLRK